MITKIWILDSVNDNVSQQQHDVINNNVSQ